MEACRQKKGNVMRGKALTQDTIDLIKMYLNDEKYTALTLKEIAAITKTSMQTVSRVKAGQYDQPKPEVPKAPKIPDDGAVTVIPYEELRKLLEYETAIKEILDAALLSEHNPNMLFIPSPVVYRTLIRVCPSEVQAQLLKLQTEDTI